MPALLKSQCPKCQATLKVNDVLAGKRVRCPACQHVFELTSVQSASSSASLERAPLANETLEASIQETRQDIDVPSTLKSRESGTGLGKLGRFELKELLGQGAYGRVYRAFDPQLERVVALKVPIFGPEDKQKIQRFSAEAKAAAKLRHPNIVPTYESGQIGAQYYIAAQFVAGQTLACRIEQNRPDYRQAAEWVRQLANALAYAHAAGIVHRDIKPENIILDEQGVPHIMDFGLAKRVNEDSAMTTDGSVLGTPAYMAPEQARGELAQVGPHSDQYSLGVVLYQLLTGKKPFEGAPHSVIAKVIAVEPPSPRSIRSDIPEDLEAICEIAMNKNAAERYPSCAELSSDIARWLGGYETEARPLNAFERGWRWCRRNSLVAGLAAAVVLLGTFGLVTTSTLVWMFAKNTQRDESPIRADLSLARPDDATRTPVSQGQIPDAEGFISLFNGKDLTGWSGDTNCWSVEDGVITAKKPAGNLRTHSKFLIWEGGRPADFELRARYKIDARSDAGIQYRSKVSEGDSVLIGYQADIDTRSTYLSSGAFWVEKGERGREFLAMRGERVTIESNGTKKVEQIGDKDWLQGKIADNDWNEYWIVAKGNHIQHHINGVLMSEVIDNETFKAATFGIIAFQFDPLSDKPVQFKDVRLKEFGPSQSQATRTAEVTSQPPLELGDATKGSQALRPQDIDGYALQFEAENVVWVDTLQLDRTAPFTLELYAMPASYSFSGFADLLGVRYQSDMFLDAGSNYLHFAARFANKVADVRAVPIPANKRTHLAGVRTERMLRVFIDGKVVSSQAIEEQPLIFTTNRFFIGGRQFSGVIDEVRISKVARYDNEFSPIDRFEPDSDTLALYHFDDGKGDVLTDSSGNGRHGRIAGAKWVMQNGDLSPIYHADVAVLTPENNPSKTIANIEPLAPTAEKGQAQPSRVNTSETSLPKPDRSPDPVNNISLRLNGVDDYVKVPKSRTASFPMGGSPRTVELWFKAAPISKRRGSSIFQYGWPGDGQMFGLLVYYDKGMKLYFYGHGNGRDLDGNTIIQSNTWYHSAVTYDGSLVKLYLNGALDASGAKTLDTKSTDDGLLLGWRPLERLFWNGQIDEVRVWNLARTQAEIQRDMRLRLGADGEPLPKNLVAYYTFDDGTARDLAGGDNNGNLASGAKAPTFSSDAPGLDP